MKIIALLVVLLAVFSATYAIKIKAADVKIIKPVNAIKIPAPTAGADEFCSLCVSFMGEAIDELINIIGNVGLGAGCHEVCSLLKNNLEADACLIICEIAGIDALEHAINALDPSPISVCEEIDICAHSTTAAGKIMSVNVSPRSGPQGTTFTVAVDFSVTNTVATGQIEVVINPPASFPFGDGSLLVDTKPGNYGFKLQFQANPSEQEQFMPGNYQVIAALCEGQCGSDHEWAYTLSQMQGNFNITQ